jgi:CRISPR-associated protein Cas1
MRWLTKHDIPILLLNWNGNLLATVNPQEPKNGKLRVKQYAKYLDNEARCIIAEEMVREKVSKSLQLLTELATYYPELNVEEIKTAFATEQDNYQKTTRGQRINEYSLNKILTYEGRISTIYWVQLRKIFNKLYPQFNYKGRKNKSNSWNMNASDEINALLNYGYAVLESQVRKYINAVGLDQAVGYLHELAPSKTPLVYDLQELYRWIVDLSVVHVLEDKKLMKSDFIVTDHYHVRLEEYLAQMLIAKLKLNFNMSMPYKKKNYAYEHILMDSVQKLSNYIMDRDKTLAFDIPEVKITRDDDLELREFILNMRPEERRKLGINRNTLWYMRENLKKGKKIKLYEKVKDKINLQSGM